MVDYGKTITEGLKFSFTPKRWLPVYAVDLTAFVSIYFLFMSNFAAIRTVIEGISSGYQVLFSLVNLVVITIAILVSLAFVRLYITGSIIHQSYKNKEYSQSWRVSKERFWSLFAASFIITIATTAFAFVPYVGWIFTVILGIMFFYALPPVIIRKMKFDDALTESIHLFKEKFPEVIITYILIAVISLIIMGFFMIPAFIAAWNVLLPILINNGANLENFGFFDVLQHNAVYLFPSVLVLLAGQSLVTVFSLFCQTNYYLEIRKKGKLIKI